MHEPSFNHSLPRLGSALGHDVHDAMGIVTVKTYKRWLREEAAGLRRFVH